VPDSNSSLGKIYRNLVRDAIATGQDQGRTLSKGARVAVRIRDGRQTVTFSRRRTELGADELDTFVKHCQVPPGAERIPAEGQRTAEIEAQGTRYYVAYRWPLTQDMFATGEPE
jgi:hypothetical protein